jgi:predicted esterase
MSSTDPHGSARLLTSGPVLAELGGAGIAMILIHGRGATPEDIIGIADLFPDSRISAIAPEASGLQWYPQRFIAPRDANQPFLDSALNLVDTLVRRVLDSDIPPERLILGGFSQGACLAGEYAASHPRRYGGVFVLSGGVIGPPGGLPEYSGSLEGTPVLIGCADHDFHIPVERVRETAEIMEQLSASVELQIFPGTAHSIFEDEVTAMRRIVGAVGS